MNEEIKEIVKFLKPEARLDLKAVSLIQILGLTGCEDGRHLIISTPEILRCLILLSGDPSESVAKDACLSLVNISADETAIPVLLGAFVHSKDGNNSTDETKEIVSQILSIIVNPESSSADPACMVLSNMSRPIAYCEIILDRIENSSVTFEKLIGTFCNINYNKKKASLDYLAPVFCNLSRFYAFRRYLLDRKNIVLQKLLPFTTYQNSLIRRGGIVGTLRNCCFDLDDHEWLLSDAVDILPQLLLPLAGPEEFDEEDNEKLPLDLQYLPEDKSREPDPDIRMMLLEAITKLCAIRSNRMKIRDSNTYVILRELHKWEKDRKALLACENLVDLLIRTEEEIGEENLLALNVPDDLTDNFSKMDEEFLHDSQ